MSRILFCLNLIIIFFLCAGTAFAQLNYSWAQQGGGTGIDQGHDIAIDRTGNVYTTGVYEGDAVFTSTPGVGDTLFHTAMSDAFISKYDASGNYEWAIRIIGDVTQPGNQNQIPYSIATDTTGNIYITGRIDSKSDFDPSDAPGDTFYLHPSAGTAFIAKYNPSGQLVWAKNYGGPTYVQGSAIQIGSSGNIYILGYFIGSAYFNPLSPIPSVISNGGYDIYLAQFDAQGNNIWVNGFGSTGSDFAADMSINANEDIFMIGRFEGTVDFDPGPGTTLLTSAGNSDPVIARYTSSGTLTWAKNISGTGTEYIFKMDVDVNNNTAVVGYITANADFDPSPNTHIITPVGGQDGFIAHYNGNGDLNWAFSPGNSTNDAANSVAFGPAGEVFVAGVFEGTIDLDPSVSNAFFSATQTDMYVVQYSTLGNYIWAGTIGGPSFDFANSVVGDDAGNFYATGGFIGPADMDPDTASQTVNILPGYGSFDVFTLKLISSSACPPVTITLNTGICSGDSILFNGIYISQAGTYYDTLQTSLGCDSIIQLQLSLLNNSTSNINTAICPGDSIFFNGAYIFQGGTYYDTLQNAAGCDSIIQLQLNILNNSMGNITADICQGDSIFFNSAYISQPGTYSDTLMAANGCDSIVQLQLTVLNNYTIFIPSAICEGDSVLFSGQYLTAAGSYYDSLTTVAGCDSVLLLELLIKPLSYTTVDTAITPGDSILIGNEYISAAGTYFDTLTAFNQCDSIVTYNVVLRFGIATPGQSSIAVWPNPTNGAVYFSGIQKETFLRIYDIYGRLLEKRKLEKNSELDLSIYPKGIYFLHLTGYHDNRNEVVRLVVQ